MSAMLGGSKWCFVAAKWQILLRPGTQTCQLGVGSGWTAMAVSKDGAQW
jgi:uncharacterized protein (DUF2237 family)